MRHSEFLLKKLDKRERNIFFIDVLKPVTRASAPVTCFNTSITTQGPPQAARGEEAGYSLDAFVGGFSTLGPIQTVWTLTNSWIPKEESSRPYPLLLTPPKGRRGSDAVIPLMKTPPASMRAASSRACSISRVQRLLLKPN